MLLQGQKNKGLGSAFKAASSEGIFRGVSRILQKVLGVSSGGFDGVLLLSSLVGAAQMFGGLILALVLRASLWPGKIVVLSALCLGIGSAVNTALSLWTFTYPGADLAVASFIVQLQVILMVLVDRFFYAKRIEKYQLFSVALFLFAGWSVFGFPQSFPTELWVFIAFANACGLVVNNIFSKYLGLQKAQNVFVSNFWIGLMSSLSTLVLFLVFFSSESITFTTKHAIVALMVGLIVLGMISFKLLAFKHGASLVFESVIQLSVYFVLLTMGGWLLLGEEMHMGKVLAMLIFPLAVYFTRSQNSEYKA